MAFENYWNEVYKERKNNKIVYDNWLDKYLDILQKSTKPILDLGCGFGNDTLYLLERGMRVISCDYSIEALANLKRNIPNADARKVDISKKLPFADEKFDCVIADLTLHYFDNKTTIGIMQEIKRILRKGGHLFARVNSVYDTNHGAGQGKELEHNFFFVEGYNKRFFDMEDVNKYFSIIGKVEAHEAEMLRYEKAKKLIEINVEKVD